MIIHPRLLRLLETGRHALETTDLAPVRATLADARQMMREQERLFEALCVSIPLRGETGQKVTDIRSLFRHNVQTMRTLEQAIASQDSFRFRHALDDLTYSLKELLPALGQLDELERRIPRASPMPLINRVILIGRNVRDGLVPRQLLQELFGGVSSTAQNLAETFTRFCALHEAPAGLTQEWASAYKQLEAALGALATYLTRGSGKALDDALVLLGTSTRRLMGPLTRMDEISRNDVSWSKLVALDELLKAVTLAGRGTVPPSIVQQTAGRLRTLGGLYASALDTVPRFPLAFMVSSEVHALQEAMELLGSTALPWMATLRDDPVLAIRDSATVSMLATRFETASTAHEQLQDALARHVEALHGAPQLQEIVELLGRLTSESVDPAYVIERVNHYLDMQQDLINQIDETGNPDLTGMRTLLAEQTAALEEMGRYLEEHDESHLRNGFLRLTAIHPATMELASASRAAAEAQREARERTVSCLRCGASNLASNRYCTHCNATLPTTTLDDTVYTDIHGGEESTTRLPGNLQRLQAIWEQAEGGAELPGLVPSLQAAAEEWRGIAHNFETGLAGRADRAGDSMLSKFTGRFRATLTAMLAGVDLMIEGARASHLAVMQRGLENALIAGGEMQQAQIEMQSDLVDRMAEA